MCVASGWTLVFMSVIAGWCFLGLEALISDVGGVFGHSGMSPHQIDSFTPAFAAAILSVDADKQKTTTHYPDTHPKSSTNP
jgi:putative membrane protein